MQRVVGFVWRWRWLLTAAMVVGISAAYYMRWRNEESRIAGWLALAEQALAAREYSSAREHLNSYLHARPKDARARLLAARVARRLHLYDEAADTLRKCQEAGGDGEAIETEFALAAVERGNATEVSSLRARVAEKDDELSLVILEVLIQHDLDLDQLRNAQQGYNLYLARKPDDLYALLGRGQLWERFLSFADARSRLPPSRRSLSGRRARASVVSRGTADRRHAGRSAPALSMAR